MSAKPRKVTNKKFPTREECEANDAIKRALDSMEIQPSPNDAIQSYQKAAPEMYKMLSKLSAAYNMNPGSPSVHFPKERIDQVLAYARGEEKYDE